MTLAASSVLGATLTDTYFETSQGSDVYLNGSVSADLFETNSSGLYIVNLSSTARIDNNRAGTSTIKITGITAPNDRVKYNGVQQSIEYLESEETFSLAQGEYLEIGSFSPTPTPSGSGGITSSSSSSSSGSSNNNDEETITTPSSTIATTSIPETNDEESFFSKIKNKISSVFNNDAESLQFVEGDQELSGGTLSNDEGRFDNFLDYLGKERNKAMLGVLGIIMLLLVFVSGFHKSLGVPFP